MSAASELMPTWFLSHGPGPAWFLPAGSMGPMLKNVHNKSPSAEFLQELVKAYPLPQTPKALLAISAHWEEPDHTLMTNPKPELYFDYYGFPKESYKLTWPVPGPSIDVLNRTRHVLQQAGIKFTENSKRGLDHGVFIPLKLAFPKADIPVYQISLKSNLSIADHIKFGEAISPLSREGILIIGSGHTTHNSDEVSAPPGTWAIRFKDWIHNVVTSTQLTSSERRLKLLASNQEETFRKAHPRIEHYLPLVVAAAAAGYKPGSIVYEEFIMGSLLCSHIMFSQ